MTKRMLIDATHAEETRVVVLDGNRLEDFDVETSTKRQLKGNIYLAKVVRVEPSLQAAFVEYGGNRHGFLAFGEIHPDYYQIPVADRQRLIEMQAEEARREEEEEDRAAEAAAGEAVAATRSGRSQKRSRRTMPLSSRNRKPPASAADDRMLAAQPAETAERAQSQNRPTSPRPAQAPVEQPAGPTRSRRQSNRSVEALEAEPSAEAFVATEAFVAS